MKKIIFAALILFSGLSSISYAAPMQQNVQLVKANEVLQAYLQHFSPQSTAII